MLKPKRGHERPLPFKPDYIHVAGPCYGGLGVEPIPSLPIKERQKALIGEVITEEDALNLLVSRDAQNQQRFKGVRECIAIRS